MNRRGNALKEAIESNNAATLELLFQQKIDPNVTLCDDGELPLIKAAMCGSDRAMHVILNHGASVTATDTWGNTALHWAAVAGNMNCVYLLLQHGIFKDTFNRLRKTPLMQAVSYEHIDVVRYLIVQGASTTPELNDYDESALTLASYAGNVAIVELILTVKVPKKFRKRQLYASLTQAVLGEHMAVAQILLTRGAPVNLPSTSIENPLFAAIRRGNASIIRLLLSQGANVKYVDQHGYTPLMEATRRRNVDAIRALLTAGADINAVNMLTRETAFFLAEERGYAEISEILLEAVAKRAT
uniref:Ankyrin repeat domain containing protein n=1 Tax=Echinococcus granulosus TaxID=6210 RepID=A0A068WQ44_ECHGR|nr:Ankyrin repeat domain containing protein [Echinococcus granulosus]